jgi:hypothetical protein
LNTLDAETKTHGGQSLLTDGFDPSPQVEALIASVMAKHKGLGTLSQARYYEAVHQELAPLARELERENRQLKIALKIKAEEHTCCAEDLIALRSLCRQLYEAERDKNQQDWTAVIRALEKVGADSTAPMGSNVQGDRRCAASSRSVQRAKRTGSTAGLAIATLINIVDGPPYVTEATVMK